MVEEMTSHLTPEFVLIELDSFPELLEMIECLYLILVLRAVLQTKTNPGMSISWVSKCSVPVVAHWNNSVLTERKQSLADLGCYKHFDYYRCLDDSEAAEAAEALALTV